MPWSIIVSPRAKRDMISLSRRDREALQRALDALADGLGFADVKKLSGSGNDWRLRVGRWRIILELHNQTGTIRVTRVLPRDRAYRR